MYIHTFGTSDLRAFLVDMENLRDTYQYEEDDDDDNSSPNTPVIVNNRPPFAVAAGATVNGGAETPEPEPDLVPELPSSDDVSDNQNTDTEINYPKSSPKFTKVSETEEDEEEDEEDEEEEPPPKKQKPLSSLTPPATTDPVEITTLPSSITDITTTTPMTAKGSASKNNKAKSKSKKKNNNVWTKPASRKGKKKNKNNSTQKANNKNGTAQQQAEDKVLITPIPRFPDKNDDNPDMKICLSKVYKAEKVELSEDRLSAGSTKGYRMVRATRGVMDGAWYYEIKVVKLGVTGHARLGWSTDKGDLQAPVGYDANSYGYRDIDGSKIYKALREKYGEEGYEEGDVLGFYINLPEGDQYAPSPPRLVWYKGQRYMCALDAKENPPKIVPGSEISFFKNGICQGVAFKDLYGGRYYPAASMYTLPNQSNCVVKFNFGPEFECFPEDFGGRTVPKPMIEVPYHGFDLKVDNGVPWNSTGMCPILNVMKDQENKIVDTADMVC